METLFTLENGMWIAGVLAIANYFIICTHFIPEYERAVRFRMGRAQDGLAGPGPVVVLWPLSTITRVSQRVGVMEIQKQDAITKDNVSITVSAAAYYKVVDVRKFVLGVEDGLQATNQVAQTTLRSIIGEFDLNTLLSEQSRTTARLREIIDRATEVWGVEVSSVEIRSVDLPEGVRRAMGQAAEASREASAKIIAAEAEFNAAAKLAEAAHVLASEPGSMELRRLQTLAEIAIEQNSTIIFPFPIELLRRL